MTEAPTLDERYICAMKSSHLEVVPHKRGDVDFVMAAGAARRRVSDRRGDDVAGQLVRLQQEFDQARSEVHLVERNHQRTQEQAKVVAKRGGKATAAQMRDGAYRDALMARAHILLKLPSRAATKEAFGRWAREQALKVNFMAPGPVPIERAPLKVWAEKVRRREEIIRAIAGRVLDIILDPLCLHCNGLGFTGGYDGKPQTFICKHCVGGRRTAGAEERESEAFARHLHVQVEIMLGAYRREMGELLSN
jgi:hypothetical protein